MTDHAKALAEAVERLRLDFDDWLTNEENGLDVSIDLAERSLKVLARVLDVLRAQAPPPAAPEPPTLLEQHARVKAAQAAIPHHDDVTDEAAAALAWSRYYAELDALLAWTPPALAASVEPETWACADCGKRRTKAEGGNVFTVCDDCWDKPKHPAPPVVETPLNAIERLDLPALLAALADVSADACAAHALQPAPELAQLLARVVLVVEQARVHLGARDA